MKKDLEAFWKQANNLFNQKDYEGVLRLLSGIKDEDLGVFLFRGMSLSRLNRQEEALVVLTRGLDAFPENPELLAERAVVFLHMGKKSLCILDLDKAVEVDRNNAYRYASRGFVREKLGDVEGAAFDYEKALELDPSDAITHNNLGMIFEKKGRPQQANHHFKWADTLQGLNGAEIWNNEQDGPASPTAEENQPMPLPWWKEMWRPITEKKERQAFWRWVKTRKSSN